MIPSPKRDVGQTADVPRFRNGPQIFVEQNPFSFVQRAEKSP